jgi:hypothetical protein
MTAFAFVPFEYLIPIFIGDSADSNEILYTDHFLKFKETYDRANPLTKKKGYENYLEKLKEKGLITEDQFFKFVESLNKNSLYQLEELMKIRLKQQRKMQIKNMLKKKAENTSKDIESNTQGYDMGFNYMFDPNLMYQNYYTNEYDTGNNYNAGI